MRKYQRVSLLAATVLLASPVSNADGFYFGISGGVSSIDTVSKSDIDQVVSEAAQEAADTIGATVEGFDSSLDDTGNVWGLQVGYQWNRYVGAELGYIYLGKALYEAEFVYTDGIDTVLERDTLRVTSKGFTIAALGFLPIGEHVDLHAKGGVYFADTRLRMKSSLPDFDESIQDEMKASTQELFAGIGAAWNINDNYALRFEYQRFFDVGNSDIGKGDVDVATVSLLFR
ncbi:MAG TPA: outer membrane beta-barrel protein [Steroidobacteraceae bacterium]|nr:outer membrane beta-barrel protein [Steroidobacteraceae bacterium]